jgi:hypothetical protein
MASYQDIETRLRVVEDKIDLVMKSFQITKQYQHPLVPGKVVQETKSLLDVYRELKAANAQIENPAPEVIEGVLNEDANGTAD